MTWLTDILTPLVAVLASFLGVLLTLDQLTRAARLRKKADFVRGESKSAAFTCDRAVFESLHREILAELIALQLVPGRKFALPVGMLLAVLIAPVLVIIALNRVTLSPADMGWQPVLDGFGGYANMVKGAIILPIISFLGVFGIVDIVVKRRMVKRQYLEGEDVFRPSSLLIFKELFIGQPTSFFQWIGMTALCVWLSLYPFFETYYFELFRRGVNVPTGHWLFVGRQLVAPTAAISIVWVWCIYHYRREDLNHPRPVNGLARSTDLSPTSLNKIIFVSKGRSPKILRRKARE